jgi:adenine-specific DNA-methyltransferase
MNAADSAKVESKRKIEAALAAFGALHPRQAALDLLSVLGYRSPRQVVLNPNTLTGLRAYVADASALDRAQAHTADWQTVDVVCQITDEEIGASGQLSMFQPPLQTDLEQSYLFMVIGLKAASYSRTILAEITRQVNRLWNVPTLVIFRYGDRLSLAVIDRRQARRDASHAVLEKVTLIKDVRLTGPHRAHLDILYELSLPGLRTDKQSITCFRELHAAWQRALDISALNKRFYQDLANWYFWAVPQVVYPQPPDVTDAKAYTSQNVIRLITRLIFVWFMKEKALVPEALFDKAKLDELLNYSDPNSSTYYKAILQNLFFATLNQEMNTPGQPDNRKFRSKAGGPGQRDQHFSVPNLCRYERFFTSPERALTLFGQIPFLNGGLFECLDRTPTDGTIVRVDSFSDRTDNPLKVPDCLFFSTEQQVDLNDTYGTKNKRYKVRGLVDTLHRYKFTVTENTPLEQEVALDPELLGRVFENLLAAYNPETGVTARKQTGSFYTPRETVDYMVEESLVAYLETRLRHAQCCRDDDDLAAKLRTLVSRAGMEHGLGPSQVAAAIACIDEVKVLDPACGSGAFPMGMLNRLVLMLHKLDPSNEQWKNRQMAKVNEIPDATVRERVAADIEEAFTSNELDYGRKLYLIENCIYGVDIQPIAVQIAKLRCFLSLLVDQRVDDLAENRGVRSLPNLETKFVAANSLLDVPRPQQPHLISAALQEHLHLLHQVRAEHFRARTLQKKQKCRAEDKRLRQVIKGLLEGLGFAQSAAQLLADWDPYDQMTAAGFFDSDWMFGLPSGFDIVIGNPPYLESRHPAFTDGLKSQYQAAMHQRWGSRTASITRGTDLLVYFIESSLLRVRAGGIIVLITHSGWLDTEYGRDVQDFLRQNASVRALVDSDYRFFPKGEGPEINAIILIMQASIPVAGGEVAFRRYHVPFDVAAEAGSSSVESRGYEYHDPVLAQWKWGTLLLSTDGIMKLLRLLQENARLLADVAPTPLKCGQGLNLTRDYLVCEDLLLQHPTLGRAAMPIMTKADETCYSIERTTCCILYSEKLLSADLRLISRKGIQAVPHSLRRPASLILPRGIGRHYCSWNSIGAYSDSGVEIYSDVGEPPNDVVLNLWLFLNSTFFWLLREVTGRKNLGGGMLKSEAVDVANIPVYVDLGMSDLRRSLWETMRGRKVLPILEEITTDAHLAIDGLVAQPLGIDNDLQSELTGSFRALVEARAAKGRGRTPDE